MTILAVVIALVSLVGFVAVWLQLQTVKKTVEHLEQLHESSDESRSVALKGLSLHSFPNEGATALQATERLIILGYRDLTIDLGNQPDGNAHGVIKDVKVDTPPGTTHVVASLRGFFLMFGSVIRNAAGDIVALNAKDHHLGYEALNITVIEVVSGAATLNVSGVLRDKNGDDSWSGTVIATVLFLGRHP